MNLKLVLFSIVLALSGCNYNQSKAPPAESTQNGQQTESLNYAAVNSKVFANNCISCHSVGGGNRGGVNLETYDQVFKNIVAIRDEVSARQMPPSSRPPLSDSQIQMLLMWIDSGAHEETVLNPPPVEPEQPPVAVEPIPPIEPPTEWPEQITFEIVFKQVVGPSCIQCHSEASGNGGDVNLETYDNFVAVKDRVRETVADGSMPRRSRLSDQQKKLILKWIDQGALEKAL